jgi:hypothetical protein
MRHPFEILARLEQLKSKPINVKYLLRGVSKRFRLEERRVEPQNVAHNGETNRCCGGVLKS